MPDRETASCDACSDCSCLAADDRALVHAEEGVGDRVPALVGLAAVRKEVAPEDAAGWARRHVELLKLDLDINCLVRHRGEENMTLVRFPEDEATLS